MFSKHRSLSLAKTPLIFAATLLVGCADGEFNIFSIQDDIDLGQQLRDEIASNPDDYPVLDEAAYPDAYNHLYAIRDEILDSGEVQYADDFEWEVYIIDDDDTLNAFCAPGGYIYAYTGLIRFLEYEDEFAGVMGHEIAHADRRHATRQLSKSYGISTLLGLILGEDPGLVAEIAAGLAGLSFSRADEAEADEYSVRYLCETGYAADGAAGFFEKLEGFEIPEFLSTHPSSDTRVDDIHDRAQQLGCSIAYDDDADYDGFLDSLP